MVYIYAARCSDFSYSQIKAEYGSRLPEPIRRRMTAYRREEDALRYLLGKVLLLQGFSAMGCPDLNLNHLRYERFEKPYVENGLHFNISHSGNQVLCAICPDGQIGIDLEEMNQLEMSSFTRCFTPVEWACIKDSDQPVKTFYQLWTRKEAVIKADGRGLQIPLQSLEVLHPQVWIDPHTWFTTELPVAAGYIAHLATARDIGDAYRFLHL